MQDYYEILQVHPKADAEAIRAAYERLRQRYDPQLLAGAADELVELARRRRDAIEHAFAVLGDPERRKTYDEELAARASAEPAPAPPAAAYDDDAPLDYRPLPPAQRRERPKDFDPQPTLPRSRTRSSGRAVERKGRLPTWMPIALFVGAATFGVVLATLISTVLNAPEPTVNSTGPNPLNIPTVPAATPSTEQIVNRFEGQIVAARQVTTQAPDNPNAWIELGNALYDSAVVVRERLGSGDTSVESVYIERLPRWLEAGDAYRRALELQPDNAIVRADLAASLCYYGSDANDQSFVGQGIVEAEQALQRDPESGRVLLSMGLCLVSVNPPQTEEALVQWQKLVVLPDIDPNLAFQARQLIAAYSQ